MSQSIPTGYIPPPPPPGNSQENLFELIPAILANFFCLILCHKAKTDSRIPRGGRKSSQTRRNCCILNLQKSLKNYEDYDTAKPLKNL